MKKLFLPLFLFIAVQNTYGTDKEKQQALSLRTALQKVAQTTKNRDAQENIKTIFDTFFRNNHSNNSQHLGSEERPAKKIKYTHEPDDTPWQVQSIEEINIRAQNKIKNALPHVVSELSKILVLSDNEKPILTQVIAKIAFRFIIATQTIKTPKDKAFKSIKEKIDQGKQFNICDCLSVSKAERILGLLIILERVFEHAEKNDRVVITSFGCGRLLQEVIIADFFSKYIQKPLIFNLIDADQDELNNKLKNGFKNLSCNKNNTVVYFKSIDKYIQHLEANKNHYPQITMAVDIPVSPEQKIKEIDSIHVLKNNETLSCSLLFNLKDTLLIHEKTIPDKTIKQYSTAINQVLNQKNRNIAFEDLDTQLTEITHKYFSINSTVFPMENPYIKLINAIRRINQPTELILIDEGNLDHISNTASFNFNSYTPTNDISRSRNNKEHVYTTTIHTLKN